MNGLRQIITAHLFDAAGVPVGVVGTDGKEYLFSTVPNATPATAQPSQASIAITGGTINGASIGATAPSTVKTTGLQAAVFTDISGSPGNGTSSGTRGRAAFAAASATITVTSTLVTATSSVFVQIGGADATLTTARVTPGAGAFTVTGNAAATAATPFDFFVVN